MPLGFLAQIQPGEGHTEGRHAPQDVGEPSRGDRLVAGRHQRAQAELERLGEFRGRQIGRNARQLRLRFCERFFRQVARGHQAIADLRQQDAIRLVSGPDSVPQLARRVCGRQRQLAAKGGDVFEVQVGGLPARQPGGLPGNFWRDAWIAVAIAANPRPESDWAEAAREGLPGRLDQRAIHRTEILRHRFPQALFEHHEAGAHFVEWRDPLAPHFVGLPRRRDFTMKLGKRIFLFCRRQVWTIPKRQDLGDAVVFLEQCAPNDFGRVRGEHELDAHRFQCGRQCLGRHAGAAKPRQGLGARSALRAALGIACMISAAMHPVMLLGDVREGQKMREGTGNRLGRR